VLLDAPADLAARDEQEALDAAERCLEPRRIVVVGKANSDTLCSEITRPVEIASACDHSVGGNSLEEFGDDESTQPTSRCSETDHPPRSSPVTRATAESVQS
jgi:hypothetical protein